MPSLFSNTKNSRTLIKGSLRYIRSDVPDKLDEAEINWLVENNIITIVDLRSPYEVKNRPCCLEKHKGFQYVNIPVTGGNKVPESVSMVVQSYLEMVDDTMWKIISFIEHAETNVMYFCTAGKDRTGVLSALLLRRLGATRNEIISDYTASYDNLKEMLENYSKQNLNVNIDIITPKSIYIEQFLDNLH